MLIDGGLQRAKSEALQLAVDREDEVAPILSRADRLNVLYDAAQAVFPDAARSGRSREMGLEGQLDALLAGIVHAGEADKMRRHFAARIVAAELAVLIDPPQAERGDRIPRIRRHLALQIDKVACRFVELLLQLANLDAEQRGELAALRGGELNVPRNRPDRLHRRGDRQRVAAAVDDPAARRRNLEEARIARVTLALQELGFERLEIERAPSEEREACGERRKHEPRSPDREPDQPLGHRAHRDGATSLTRRGSGARMPRVEAAILSTRWARPQVLASSCNCPCSMSSSRARFCSRSRSENSFLALCCEVTSPSAQATRTARRRRFSFATARRARFEIGPLGKAPRCARPPEGWRSAPAGFFLSLAPRPVPHDRSA